MVSLESELKGEASIYLSQSFLEHFPFNFFPFTKEIKQNYTIENLFTWGNKLSLGAGDRDTLQGGTQKRKKSCKFIQGLSGFGDSGRFHLCTNVILHKSPLTSPAFWQSRRERFTHDGVPARCEKHRAFLWKETFFFSVKLFIQSKWWMFVHNWLPVLHWNCFVTVSRSTAVCD